MRVLVPLLRRRFLGAAFRMLVLGMRVPVRMERPIGMAVLVLVLDVLVGMSMARVAVLVFVGMLLAVECLRFHIVVIVYRNRLPLQSPADNRESATLGRKIGSCRKAADRLAECRRGRVSLVTRPT